MGGGAASSTASRLASTSPGRGRTPAVVCNGLVQMTPPPLHSTIDDTLDYCGPASPWRGGRGRALAVTGTRACPPLPLHTQMKLRGGQSVGSGHAHPPCVVLLILLLLLLQSLQRLQRLRAPGGGFRMLLAASSPARAPPRQPTNLGNGYDDDCFLSKRCRNSQSLRPPRQSARAAVHSQQRCPVVAVQLAGKDAIPATHRSRAGGLGWPETVPCALVRPPPVSP